MSTSEPEHETHKTQAVKDLSDSQVRQYLRKFYYISNDISLDKEWGDLFTEDGVYIMGNKKAKGPEGTFSLTGFPTIPPKVVLFLSFFFPPRVLFSPPPFSPSTIHAPLLSPHFPSLPITPSLHSPLLLIPHSHQTKAASSAIRKLRKKLFEDIPSRDHSPIKIFSHGNHDDDTELMILGTVGWTYHAGHGHEGDWAAHVKLHKGNDGVMRIIALTPIHLLESPGAQARAEMGSA
ncbi:MAG: hypothetical protein Q9192_006270 [Flavoplaca navasiana]